MITLIAAAGANTRFDGENKVLARIGSERVLDRLVSCARQVSDRILLTTRSDLNAPFPGVDRVVIDDTLSGNAGTVREAYREEPWSRALVVWGDAWIIDPARFVRVIEGLDHAADVIIPVVEMSEPYAGFRTLEPPVAFSSRVEDPPRTGWHDQCVFVLSDRASRLIDAIEPKGLEGRNLLDIAGVAYERGLSVSLPVLDAPIVLSFNTREDLEIIRSRQEPCRL